jgi:hypothetical protein
MHFVSGIQNNWSSWLDDGLHGHYEFSALLSTGSGALTMRVRFR